MEKNKYDPCMLTWSCISSGDRNVISTTQNNSYKGLWCELQENHWAGPEKAGGDEVIFYERREKVHLLTLTSRSGFLPGLFRAWANPCWTYFFFPEACSGVREIRLHPPTDSTATWISHPPSLSPAHDELLIVLTVRFTKLAIVRNISSRMSSSWSWIAS